MQPSRPQITPANTGASGVDADHLGLGFVAPRPVMLRELKADSTTGRYTATKPGTERQVDTKVEISSVKADKEKDAEKSKLAKKFMEENASEIEVMRSPLKRIYGKGLIKNSRSIKNNVNKA